MFTMHIVKKSKNKWCMSLLMNSSQNSSTIKEKNKFTPNSKYNTKMLNLKKFNQISFRTSTSRSPKTTT